MASKLNFVTHISSESTKNFGDKNYLERKCTRLDKEIDELVYQLYGLTEEEIKIVEGSVNR